MLRAGFLKAEVETVDRVAARAKVRAIEAIVKLLIRSQRVEEVDGWNGNA